jgi:hypothetical protein
MFWHDSFGPKPVIGQRHSITSSVQTSRRSDYASQNDNDGLS